MQSGTYAMQLAYGMISNVPFFSYRKKWIQGMYMHQVLINFLGEKQ